MSTGKKEFYHERDAKKRITPDTTYEVILGIAMRNVRQVKTSKGKWVSSTPSGFQKIWQKPGTEFRLSQGLLRRVSYKGFPEERCWKLKSDITKDPYWIVFSKRGPHKDMTFLEACSSLQRN